MPNLITQAECARRLKVSHQAVRYWLETAKLRGFVQKDCTVKVDWSKAKYLEPRRPIGAAGGHAGREDKADSPPEEEGGTPDDPLEMDLAKAKLKRETFLAHTAELEFLKKSGELVGADEVAKRWDAIATSLRRRLLVLPDRLAPLLAAEMDPRKVHEMMTEELHHCLSTLDQDPDLNPEDDAGGAESQESEAG